MIRVTSASIGKRENVLGTIVENEVHYGYLHGELENEYNKHDGYDIPEFLTDNVPTEEGIYQATAVFPEGKEVPATFFVWNAPIPGTKETKRLRGLIVANTDLRGFEQAYTKFKEKPWHM